MAFSPDCWLHSLTVIGLQSLIVYTSDVSYIPGSYLDLLVFSLVSLVSLSFFIYNFFFFGFEILIVQYTAKHCKSTQKHTKTHNSIHLLPHLLPMSLHICLHYVHIDYIQYFLCISCCLFLCLFGFVTICTTTVFYSSYTFSFL